MTNNDGWSTSQSLTLKATDLDAFRNELAISPDKDWGLTVRLVVAMSGKARLTSAVGDVQELTAKAAHLATSPGESAVLTKQGGDIALRIEALRRTLTYSKSSRRKAVGELSDIADRLREFSAVVEKLETS